MRFTFIALLAAASLAASAQGHVEKRSIDARTVWVYTPPVYETSKSANDLLVLFDGESYLSDIPAPQILDDLIAKHAIRPVVAVLVDNNANRLGDLANHASFADYCAKTIVPWARANYRIKPGASSVTIGGYSAGGLGATYVAFKHPEVFGNVVSQSGAFWRGNEGASEPGEWLTSQFRNSKKLPLRLVIDVGALETQKVTNGLVFIETNRRLRDVLLAKQYDVHYVEVPDAHHNEAHWRSSFGDDLRYLLHP